MAKRKKTNLRKLEERFKRALKDLDYHTYLRQNLDHQEVVEDFWEETGLTLRKCFEILRKSWQKKGRGK